MEDPWGSPWATDTNTTLEPTIPRSTLELPGRTLTRQRSFSAASPWAAEDDGLDDWAAADPGLALPTPAATSSSIWAGWGGENAPNSSQTSLAPASRAREGSLGMHSPSWPAAASPGLPPARTISRRSSSRSLFRQPSPDPWAVEFSENRLSLPTPALVSAEQAAFSTLDRHEEENEEDMAKIKEDEKAEVAAPEVTSTQDSKIAQPSESTRDEEVGPVTNAGDEASKRENEEGANTRSLSDSRHSSMSAESHHDDRPDSPITSMDEDAKDRPRIPRRPSVKVQELVHMYDGMVEPKDNSLSVPTALGGRQRSTSRGTASIRSTRTEDISEFGDFEDAESLGSAPPSRKPSIGGSPRPGSSRAGPARSAFNVKSSAPAPIPEERSHTFQDLRAKFGPVTFAPDLESVDKLFDVAKLDAEQPSAKDYSLDAVEGIIKDSFSSVSERKTWYRISRPGSMRRHDLGDDENYRRVTWPVSKMREETNKVVRRWMEEDSFSGGRPSFGGGNSVKGGAFNWDTKSEPLSMDQIFGKRKSAQPPKAASATVPRPLSLQPRSAAAHSRNLSGGVKSLPPRSPGVSSLPCPSPMSIPGPPKSPAFGWSTMTDESGTPASSRPPSRAVRQSLEVTSSRFGSNTAVNTGTHEPESRPSLQLAPPSSAPSVSSNALVEDDDEEWGEMVASPMESSRPVSGIFDMGLNSSMAELSTKDPSPAPFNDTDATLVAVASKLEHDEGPQKAHQQPPAPSTDMWDFSAFDTTLAPSFSPVAPTVPAIPPTTTSKPEFDFDTPLQSPALSGPSKTSSPISAFQLPTPSTPSGPMASSSTSSPASFQLPPPPTPPVSTSSKHTPKSSISSQPALEPVRPISPAAFQLSKPPSPKHSNRPSLSLGRPSPLQHVITPKASSPKPMSPTVHSTTMLPPAKSVSFAPPDEESAAVARIVEALPDLSYMLR